MLGLTVIYDTGAGGQYLSGAMATALGDAVAPFEFHKKDFDKDGVNLQNRNRWFFNTKNSDYKEDKVNIYVSGLHANPLDFHKSNGHTYFDRIIKVKIDCSTLWEFSMISFNKHIKNNPDTDTVRYLSDFFNFKRPTVCDFDLTFERDCTGLDFDVYFPYRAFYDVQRQKQFCKELESKLDKSVDYAIFSSMCRQYVKGNTKLYNDYLIRDL